MNMKKTIAAIAAGAVAVSAMATTVSAVESKTLNYNLAAYLEANPAAGTAKLTANFSGITIKPDTTIQVKFASTSTDLDGTLVTIGGRYVDNNKSIDNMYFAKRTSKTNYTKIGDDKLTFSNGVGTIPLDVKTVANQNSYELQADGSSETVVTGGTVTATATTGAGIVDATAVTVSAANFIANNAAAGTYTLRYNDATGNWAVVGDMNFNVGVTLAVGDAAADKDELTVTWEPQTQTTDFVSLVNLTVSVDAEKMAQQKLEAVNNDIKNGNIWISVIDSDGVEIKGDVRATMADVERFRMPFMTNMNGNIDIISYLEGARLTADADHDKAPSLHAYRNVKAVLNDAVENYEGVTFTFNTAVSGVKYVVGKRGVDPTIVAGPFGNDWEGTGLRKAQLAQQQYRTSSWSYDEDYVVMAVYSGEWDADNTYTQFGEHTYDWNYAPEGTGFTGYDWGGTNLFAGALIVNENQTMSLSETEYFDWTKTSVSFDWEAIMDNAATTNNYATYIQSLKLATSNMWFWDSMDVVLTAGEADDVTADAGAEVDDATLDDEGDDEIIADDEDEEPVVDDDEEDPAPVVDETPAPVVTNPPTGNASVALAVIPVALAAAAIVAKKRG